MGDEAASNLIEYVHFEMYEFGMHRSEGNLVGGRVSITDVTLFKPQTNPL